MLMSGFSHSCYSQGQEWTTIEALVEEGHSNKVQEIEPGADSQLYLFKS